MLHIIVAKKSGFCYGVRRALKLTEGALRSCKKPVYTYGPLIHNRQVVEKLAQQNILALDNLEVIKEGCIVIRSHGVSPKVKKSLEEKVHVIDGTCPYVAKVQKIIPELQNQGYQVVILGDRLHPEVQGLVGWSDSQAIVVESIDDALELKAFPKIALVAQTTQQQKNLQAIADILNNKCKEFQVFNTICLATKERQEEARKLAENVDVMLVVGGNNSSNTKKLASICLSTGTPTYQIEDASELQSQWFLNIKTVGVAAGASTPDWIIEEVVQKMEEFNDVKEIQKGDIVEGTVAQIKDNEVLLDFGGKSEGVIPLTELSIKNIAHPAEVLKVGDKVTALVIRVENEEGHSVLSKKRVDRQLAWDRLASALENQEEISAEVTEVVNGGVLVDVGIRGFVPASLLERGYVEDLKSYVGKKLRLRVIEIDKEKNKVVLSQKAILDEEFNRLRVETLNNLNVGEIRKGIVRRLTDFGAFVDIGGVDGLLHVSEIAWNRIDHPREVLHEGQEVEVKILKVDREKGKVSLSIKEALPNPWDKVAEKYKVGAIVHGKVLRIAPFGVFVSLEPGVEGLVHISQLANHHVNKAEEVVSIGQELELKVLNVDLNAQKIGLSLKAVQNDREKKVQEEVLREYKTNETNVTLGDVFGDLFTKKHE
ncbi:bifunctional 4-hydroxy-3-methylbut-2-enyl diphosphate reductase/30S ribosomal protein S1 [Bacillota bacterium LX-D]|nr:bifunctional 4-hydroxy-3-methylbut-2-enyl diphosphate reductase/30S ribosomal protein S1 [Bacillota bacterium LX-D]